MGKEGNMDMHEEVRILVLGFQFYNYKTPNLEKVTRLWNKKINYALLPHRER